MPNATSSDSQCSRCKRKCRTRNAAVEKRLLLDLLLLRQVHLLNIDNNLFDSMVNHIYLSELQLKRPRFYVLRTHFRIYIYLYRTVL